MEVWICCEILLSASAATASDLADPKSTAGDTDDHGEIFWAARSNSHSVCCIGPHLVKECVAALTYHGLENASDTNVITVLYSGILPSDTGRHSGGYQAKCQ
jgi:hypothetical protein